MIGTLIAAWLDVRTRPFRTFAAIAGMVAAVVSVVLVDAAAVLSRDANAAYLARQYGLSITVSINPLGAVTPEDDARLVETLRANGVDALSIDAPLPGSVYYQGQVVRSGMRLLSSTYRDIRIVDLVAGSWPNGTASSDVLHVVVHAGFGRNYLGGIADRDLVGMVLAYDTNNDRVTFPEAIPQRPMVIDGVVSVSTNAFANGSSDAIVVSDRPPPGLLPSLGSSGWVARVNPADYRLFLDLTASITDADGQALYRVDRTDGADTLAPVLDQQSVTARIVTIVALTVGGLGILGVGVAGVRERARDFGLRRALGASRLRLFSGVIVQTLLEVLLATLVAIPLAAVLLGLYARDLVLERLPLPPSTALPLSSVLLGLVGALAVGLLAGLIPAINAARTSVVRALQG